MTWQPIETYAGDDYRRVDLWMNILASPRSMGMADAFRVIDAYRLDGVWFDPQGKLEARYITHWRPIPAPPPPTKAEVAKAEAIIARSKDQ